MDINEKILYEILSKKESKSKITIQNWKIREDVIKIGENHTSKISTLEVEYKKKEKMYKKNFILKIPSVCPIYEIMKDYRAFDKEYLMYTTVLREMYNIDGEYIGPKFYYMDDRHSLFLKDLNQSGYQKISRMQQMNFNQSSSVMKHLAKFHALSVKINQEFGIHPLIKKITWEKISESTGSVNTLYKYCYDQFIGNLSDDLKSLYGNRLMKYRKTFIKNSINEVKRTIFDFEVLNHGDLWTSNILFKFNKYGGIEKTKFIDFQFPVWTTPVVDILIFTITSVQFDVYEKHFNSLLEVYIDTLNQTLNFLQCDTYDLNHLKIDLERLPGLVFHIIVVCLPLYSSDIDDPFDLKLYMKNDEFELEEMERFFRNEIYIERMKRWFLHYVEKGFLDRLDQTN